MPYLSCKKIENDVYNFPTWQYCKYKDIFDSRIIINSTAKFYISISYQKDLLSIDTRIFTPSARTHTNSQTFIINLTKLPVCNCHHCTDQNQVHDHENINVSHIIHPYSELFRSEHNSETHPAIFSHLPGILQKSGSNMTYSLPQIFWRDCQTQSLPAAAPAHCRFLYARTIDLQMTVIVSGHLMIFFYSSLFHASAISSR